MKWLLLIPVVYLCVCLFLYFVQERLIFFPDKTSKDTRYRFNVPFREMFFTTKDNIQLHGILFNSEKPKGLIFYLHGNAGSVETWGDMAELYTSLGYDLFMMDYRGYGKSEGEITNEKEIYHDVQLVFNTVAKLYASSRIIILGYSLGTGPASKLAADNKVDLLILQSPYYSMTDVMLRHYKILPPLILRYKLQSYKHIRKCQAPIVIFHGDKDDLIDIQSAMRLKRFIKPNDRFITIQGLGHHGMTNHPEYIRELQRVLSGH